jgi:hypothetical protein
LLARKRVQDKGKEIFNGGPPPRGWVVGNLRAMLQWKMPSDEYKNQKISRANRSTLITLWEHWKDQITEDIIIHDKEEVFMPFLSFMRQKWAEQHRKTNCYEQSR